jgi:(heptosyl)LPS beta-1,4-glucosyltransferase
MINGYWIPRRNIIFGKWIEHTGWYPDYQLRLFKKGKGKYIHAHYHEPIEVDGEKEYLHTDLIHENYQTIQQFISRNLLVYAKNEAGSLLANEYIFSYLDSLRFPAKEFTSRFFAREGYKDGLHGLLLSILMAIYHFVIFLYLWEAKQFHQEDISLPTLEKESKSIAREMEYWVTTSLMENEKNPIKRTFYKVKRKL